MDQRGQQDYRQDRRNEQQNGGGNGYGYGNEYGAKFSVLSSGRYVIMNGEIAENSESDFAENSRNGSEAVVRTYDGIEYVAGIADIAKASPKLFLFRYQSGRNYVLLVKPIEVRGLDDLETLNEGVNEIREVRGVSAGDAIDLIVRASKANPKLGLNALISEVLKERGGGNGGGGSGGNGDGYGDGSGCRNGHCGNDSGCRSGNCGCVAPHCRPKVDVPPEIRIRPRCSVVSRPPNVIVRPRPGPIVVVPRVPVPTIPRSDQISASAREHTMAQCMKASRYIVLNGSVTFDLRKMSSEGPSSKACYNEAFQCAGGAPHTQGPGICCRPPIRPNGRLETTMPWRCRVTQPGPGQVWVQ